MDNREAYAEDSELSAISFKRVIALTSIDRGALCGDLSDRLLLVDLNRIEDSFRRTEAGLNRTQGRVVLHKPPTSWT